LRKKFTFKLQLLRRVKALRNSLPRTLEIKKHLMDFHDILL